MVLVFFQNAIHIKHAVSVLELSYQLKVTAAKLHVVDYQAKQTNSAVLEDALKDTLANQQKELSVQATVAC